MKHAGHRILAAAVVLAALVCPRAARAQEDPQVIFADAKRSFDQLDYEKAVPTLDRLITLLDAKPAQDPARRDLPVAYEMRARSRFGLGDQAGARADFVSLLKASPSYTLTGQISPRVVALFTDAQKVTVTTLKLSVTPATAAVQLDGVPAFASGNMPVAVGAHTVSASQMGYRATTQIMQADAGKVAELTLTLERISAVLNILTSPSNVEVTIDGISRGKTSDGPPPASYTDLVSKAGLPPTDVSSPMVIGEVPPGSHLIEFKRPCYVRSEKRVTVDKPDDFAVGPVKLDHAVATLQVASTPPGAQVFIDGQSRGTTPFTDDELCEGEHTVELRALSGRYFKRVQARTGDKLPVSGVLKPAFALVSAFGQGAGLNTDLRVAVERALEPSQSVTLFAPPAQQASDQLKANQLPDGWLAFDGSKRPLGQSGDIPPLQRRDFSTRLSTAFAAQGVGSVTVPSPLDRNRVVVALLGAGSGDPDVIEVTLNNPDSVGAAIAQLDRAPSFFRPSIGLVAVDVADVTGAIVVGVDANGPAAKAGVQLGDTVLKANGQAITDAVALAALLATRKANDDLSLELTDRAGRPKRADLKVSMTPRLIGMADQTLLVNRILLDLRARLLAQNDPLEEAVIRLNLAAALARVEAWSDARLELQRVKLPDGPGVANGTVQYLIGLCSDKLGNRSEAESALKAAAASESLLTEDGPSVKELAEAKLAEIQRRAGRSPQ